MPTRTQRASHEGTHVKLTIKGSGVVTYLLVLISNSGLSLAGNNAAYRPFSTLSKFCTALKVELSLSSQSDNVANHLQKSSLCFVGKNQQSQCEGAAALCSSPQCLNKGCYFIA
jgi:hypothetical protein